MGRVWQMPMKSAALLVRIIIVIYFLATIMLRGVMAGAINKAIIIVSIHLFTSSFLMLYGVWAPNDGYQVAGCILLILLPCVVIVIALAFLMGVAVEEGM